MYKDDRVQAALDNFFKVENLSALREVARERMFRTVTGKLSEHCEDLRLYSIRNRTPVPSAHGLENVDPLPNHGVRY